MFLFLATDTWLFVRDCFRGTQHPHKLKGHLLHAKHSKPSFPFRNWTSKVDTGLDLHKTCGPRPHVYFNCSFSLTAVTGRLGWKRWKVRTFKFYLKATSRLFLPKSASVLFSHQPHSHRATFLCLRAPAPVQTLTVCLTLGPGPWNSLAGQSSASFLSILHDQGQRPG